MMKIEMDQEVESTMTEPLIETGNHGDEEEDLVKFKEQDEKPSIFSGEKAYPKRFLVVGIITGFLVHTVALGAYAVMIVHSGEEDHETSGLLMTALSFLTQVDLMVYVMIWIAFTCTLTGSGLKIIRARLGDDVQRRDVFILGVFFLVGIVLGAFTAWSLIDSLLGFSVPLTPIAATVGMDLVLCYLMIWCYDVGSTTLPTEGEDEITVHV